MDGLGTCDAFISCFIHQPHANKLSPNTHWQIHHPPRTTRSHAQAGGVVLTPQESRDPGTDNGAGTVYVSTVNQAGRSRQGLVLTSGGKLTRK
jgi:hypothetical protein